MPSISNAGKMLGQILVTKQSGPEGKPVNKVKCLGKEFSHENLFCARPCPSATSFLTSLANIFSLSASRNLTNRRVSRSTFVKN